MASAPEQTHPERSRARRPRSTLFTTGLPAISRGLRTPVLSAELNPDLTFFVLKGDAEFRNRVAGSLCSWNVARAGQSGLHLGVIML